MLESLEDLFYEYLKQSGETLAKHNFLKWFKYFKENTTYRTTCQDCYEQLVENYKMERKQIRRKEKIQMRIAREKNELANMTK